MVATNPSLIPGRWHKGIALDLHTVSGEFLGYDDSGHPRFENFRTELGDLVYRLKYRQDSSAAPGIVEAMAHFIRQSKVYTDLLVVPVPPSKPRNVQPVEVIATGLANELNLELAPLAVRRVSATPELKNIDDYNRRMEILAGAFMAEPALVKGRRILLVDDLFRSGATLNAVTGALLDQGHAHTVFALTATRTRTRQ
jgi:competence protein ComFC